MTEIQYFICGGFGGICTVLVGHPLDTIKVRLQTMPIPNPGQKPLYCGTLDCLKTTIQQEGVRGLYKGMSAPLTAVAPIFAISFMGFGLGKRLLATTTENSYAQYFASGAFSGVFTTAIMAPGERIKSLLQVQLTGPKIYNGPVDCVRKLYKEGGIQNIYRGSVATLLRDIPASGMYFLTYEAVRDCLTDNGKTTPSFLGTLFAGGCAGISHWIVGMPLDVLKSRIQTAPSGIYPKGVRDAFRKLMVVEGPAALYTGITPVLLRAVPANAACFLGFEVCRQILTFLI
ncbi:hypothetical protein MTP99_002245 [Tenebrio molitor]|jgi:solute carrier family 25 carnitine/acylcarnitine transporter 20/29|uniref:congested-like trachea protein n=1 Tax=Tenebrio molitor TaxID=7067 RepID=UPI001C3BBD33|nr:hypothetical protein MTP99_002245 [Tenebrio molitor]CAH1365940.1 unnamed protein product [Tenebrio molitor]